MSKVTKALKADLPALAELLRSKGKGKDTILAHINPKEAELLKRRGGSGDINPDTGLPMFENEGDSTLTEIGVSPAQQEAPLPTDQTAFNQSQQYADSTQAQPQQFTSAATGQPFTPAGSTGEYQGEAMGGPATTPVATTFTPTGREMPMPSAFKLTPQGQVESAIPTAPSPSITDRVGTALGNVTTEQLVKALGLGGLGVLGARNANVAGGQNQQAIEELKTIARPYQAQGQEMIGAAQRGELTPQSQQAFQAAMAQANQSLANRGGVGQQQVQAQMAALYDKLLQNQYSYGLQVANIGDNIAMGAIKQGLTLDQNLQRTTQNFYAQLAAIASGSVIGGTKGATTNA